MADGKVIYEVRADDSHVSSDLEQANKKVEQGSSKIGATAKGVAKAVGAALATMATAAGAAAVAFAKSGIQIASDLEEVQNVVDVAFGNSADAINDWAKTATNSFGISELSAKSWAGTMGAMLKSMGVASEETVQMSKDLAGLAGDIASFYNLDHDTAWEKIRSGIAGETEPLKQLGINMSVANLEAFALQEGISKTYSEMSQSEQTILRYNYLMSVSADAQGDFARTSGSWANQLRLAKLNMENMSASIGTQLIPSLTNVLQVFNKVAEESGGDLQQFINNFDKVVEAGADAAKEILPFVTSLINDILDGIVDMLPDFLDAGVEIILNLADGLTNALPQIANAMGQLAAKIASSLPDLLLNAMSAIPDIISGFFEGLFGIENQLRSARNEFESLTYEMERSTEKFEENTAAAENAAEINKKYADELYELAAKENKTAAEKERMLALVELLNESIPELNLVIDKETWLLDKQKSVVDDLIDSQAELSKIQGAKQYMSELSQQIYDAERQVEDLKKQFQELYGFEIDEEKALALMRQTASMELMQWGDTVYTAMQTLAEKERELESVSEDVVNKQTEYNKRFSDSIYETANAAGVAWESLTEIQKEALDSIGITAENYVEITEDKLGNIVSAYEEHKAAVEEWNAKIEEVEQQHNEAMGTIYDEGLNTQEISLEQATENLENQVEEYKKYRENLRDVMSKVPEDVYEYLVGLGPEAAGLIADMTTASKPELDAFVEAVRTKNALAREAAIEEIGELPDEVSGTMEDIVDTLKNTGAIENEAEDVGEEIVNGMSAGISKKRSGFLSKVTSLAKSALSSVKSYLGIQSPSKVFMEQVGLPMAQGMEVGFDEGVSSMTKRVSRTLDAQLSDISKTLATSAAQYQSNTYYQPMNAQYTGPMLNIERYVQNTPQDVTQLGYQLEIARRDAALAIGAKT